tara:strand:+ start:476 stop:1174 length:699 start_codon:yes stop_codon:yes gene_type:complete
MALGTALAIGQFAGSALQRIAGLGSNPEHEANKRRVAEIDLQNQKTLGDNLSISSNYKNRGARVQEQFDNIRLAGAQNRGRSRLMLDRAANEAAVANQGDFIKMMQEQGYRPGQMNLNRSTAAAMGRRAALRASKLTDSNEDFITNNFINSLGEQNQIKQTYEQVAVKPQYKQYITGYTPQKSNQTAKMLNFAGGLMGDAVGAMGTFDKFKVPTGFDSSKQSIFDRFTNFER